MDLRQIQYFICLYEEKSVTKAAKRLNIVQPALSMQINRLENQVGRKLFSRTPRGMESTPAADEMYSVFSPLVSAFGHAKARFKQDNSEMQGYLRLGVISSIGHNILPRMLAQFKTEHPNVSVSVTEGLSGMLYDSVIRDELDFAFINCPKDDCSMPLELVLSEEIVVVSSVLCQQPLPNFIEFNDLLHRPMIVPTRHHGLRVLLERFARKLGHTLVPAIEVDSVLTQAILVSQEQYLGFFPISVVDHLKTRASIYLRTHRVVDQPLKREIVYVHNPNKPQPQPQLAFARNLINAIQTQHETLLSA
ncbi:MAG: LysR family transcriptional regulator [Burkholderiaceae bacterium]|nr:LysR family transcriptional regulator [Burkholderiaceae bacterium]